MENQEVERVKLEQRPESWIRRYLEKQFKLKENNTTIHTEIMAGSALFLASVAMCAIQPAVLGAAGMDPTAVFWATTLSLIVTGLLYAFYVNYPFICGPSIGVSPWVAFYIVGKLGVPWEMALMCVFISGVLFILLSIIGLREKILGAIPMGLKHAFGAGIGAFITTVGLLNTGIIKTDAGSFFGLSLGDLTSIPTLMAIITIFVIAYFLVKKIQGGFLFGTMALTIAGIFIINPATGSSITTLASGSWISISNPVTALSPTLMKMSFAGASEVFANPLLGLGIIIFTFFFIDVFDTIGTVSGLCTLAGYMDKDGNIPRVNKIFMTDAIGTTVGAMLGVTTVTTYIESSVGVAEGGRTGLTSLWASGLFALTLFFAPLFTMVPGIASGAAITLIGALMIKSVLKIDLEDYTEALPAFFCIFMMPFTGNMGIGILCGVFTYTVLKLMAKKYHQVNPMLVALSVIFVLYIVSQKAL
jgi:AGZA family xanthine/uracil permease-like MFS transporter